MTGRLFKTLQQEEWLAQKWTESINPVSRGPHWLPGKGRIDYKGLSMEYSSFSGTALRYPQELIPRHAPARCPPPPPISSQLFSTVTSAHFYYGWRAHEETIWFQSLLKFYTCRLWNALPQTVRKYTTDTWKLACSQTLKKIYTPGTWKLFCSQTVRKYITDTWKLVCSQSKSETKLTASVLKQNQARLGLHTRQHRQPRQDQQPVFICHLSSFTSQSVALKRGLKLPWKFAHVLCRPIKPCVPFDLGSHLFSADKAQELCESRGGRPGLLSLINLLFLWT